MIFVGARWFWGNDLEGNTTVDYNHSSQFGRENALFSRQWSAASYVNSAREMLLAPSCPRPAGGILVPIMPTDTFALLFSWDPKDTLAPLDAEAEIVLKSDIQFHARDDRTSITNVCVNAHELEVEVARLHAELDEVLKAGRRKFAERDFLRQPA
jgi:hypothetical protein